MERISLSIADDVMREERAIAEAQHTGKSFILFFSSINELRGLLQFRCLLSVYYAQLRIVFRYL